ncbi:MAG: enoyl-CoA hydratase-related protein [Amphiplicatus sp.]
MKHKILIQIIDSRGLARLTLNRPERRNALDEELIGAVCDAMGRLNADKAVRAIVVAGAGSAFSAGLDLDMMKRIAEQSPAENKDDARRLAHMLSAVYASPKPTIALVNGPAIGAGIGIAAACDIAIAAEGAFFAFSEARLGIIPAIVAPFVIEAIGARQARRYFLTGERFDAETARRIGLVHMVAMPAHLEATLDIAVENLLLCSPAAQHEAKDLIRMVANRPVTNSLAEETANRIARLRAGPDGQEGVAAFLEKRQPIWVKN